MNEINDRFSNELGGDTLMESFYNKVKITIGDWEYPHKDSIDLKGRDPKTEE